MSDVFLTASTSYFSFVLTNGDSSRSSTLRFTIEHSDRIPPSLSRNAGLRLEDGSMATITSNQLQLTDPDTAVANLSFIITQLPRYGKLLLKGAPLASPPRFFQTDVDELHLSYQHEPSNPVETDRFSFLPSDGNNKGYLEFGQLREEPAVFDIQVSHNHTTRVTRSETSSVASKQQEVTHHRKSGLIELISYSDCCNVR